MAQKPLPRRAPTSRGQLKSMRVTEGFRTFVLEQLMRVKSMRARAMFGGVGLYADDVFFGIIAADTLYLKVDDSNRSQYEAAGMSAFQPYVGKPMTMPYYQVPASVLEDRDELARWARASVRVAVSTVPRNARGHSRQTKPAPASRRR